MLYPSILIGFGWLTNFYLLNGSDKVYQSSIQSDNFIESYATHDLLQTDVKI